MVYCPNMSCQMTTAGTCSMCGVGLAMSADILQFLPKAHSGDSDFPAIPTRASFYKRPVEPSCDLSMDHVDTAPSEMNPDEPA